MPPSALLGVRMGVAPRPSALPHLRDHCMPLCMDHSLIYFQPDLLDQAICFLTIKTSNPRLGTRKQIQLLSTLQPCLKAWPSGKLSAACHPLNVPSPLRNILILDG